MMRNDGSGVKAELLVANSEWETRGSVSEQSRSAPRMGKQAERPFGDHG
ncbi:MAG TPA: hypothetical protein PKK83_10705 [Polyangiaceae bacterium]|nr:hypothetical protein [Polyangiaceae bacterium]HPB98410.1 hypothetical protein [Polyangiaceae bacterium]